MPDLSALRPPFRQVELSEVIVQNRTGGGGMVRGHDRIVCDLRGFWLVTPGGQARKIVHSDPRKARKTP